MEIPILYIDDDLLIVDKPAGVSSTGGGFNPDIPFVQGELEPTNGRLWLVHRLDRDTSGVMILARNAATHRFLNLMFDRREINKTYLALVLGIPEWQEYSCDLPLQVNADRSHRTQIDDTGKAAVTNFELLQSYKDACLILAKPHTGLTHQIRAHLSGMGYPILMDTLYTKSDKTIQMQALVERTRLDIYLSRTALHASQIEFTHPTNNEPIVIQAPLPTDISQAIKSFQTDTK